LTRLLKDSLGGSNPISMIVCLSPNSIYLDESLNSIKYAQKAKMINTPVQRDRNWSNVPVYKEENY
jgi:kinesin family protein 18/19